jgi:hypothetical protein
LFHFIDQAGFIHNSPSGTDCDYISVSPYQWLSCKNQKSSLG